MSTRTSWMLLFGGTFLVGGCALLLHGQVNPAGGAGEPPAGLACRFQPEERLEFTVHSEAETQTEGATHGDVRQVLGARMKWRVLQRDGAEGWLVAAALSGVELDETNTADEVLRGEMQEPFLFRVDGDCHFRGFAFRASTPARARVRMEGLLQGLELRLPALPTPAVWSTEHQDGLGRYTALYQRTGDTPEGHPVLSKTRTRYSRLAGPRGDSFEARVVRSRARLVLDPGGQWLRALEGQEHLTLLAGGTQVVSWRQRLQLQRVEVQGPFPSDLDPTSFVTGNALAELQREPPAPDPRLRGMVLTGVLDEVDALLKQGRSSAHDIAEMLAQYLRFYPEKAGELLAVLKAGMYPDAVQAAAFLALERTGTPQSQAALMEALRDRQMGSMNRMRAAVALPDVPMPSQESVEGLIGVSRTGRSTGDKDEEMVAGTALRALGTVSRNVKNTQPGLARLALSEVRAELSAATETHQLTSALDAAGNSGDESLALELERFHRHDSSQVRSRAALAYRRMDARSSGPALSAWLRQEPDGTVRQSILEALLQISQAAGGSAAPRDAVTTAAAQLASETNPRTRELLIQLLGTAVQSAPEARAALVAHFHREREPRLLILIGRYVSVEELD